MVGYATDHGIFALWFVFSGFCFFVGARRSGIVLLISVAHIIESLGNIQEV